MNPMLYIIYFLSKATVVNQQNETQDQSENIYDEARQNVKTTRGWYCLQVHRALLSMFQ